MILITDDNAQNLYLARFLLEKEGHRIAEATNGQEAISAAQGETFDLILMDIQMPVMDGLEASKAILKYEEESDLEHIPVIALTADALPGDREKYISEGMDDYATKPLDIGAIKKIISTHCSGSLTSKSKVK